MFNAGVVSGYDDGTMRPYGTLTRAEFTTMLCKAFGYTSNEKSTFPDSKSHWASSYIAACVEREIIHGIGDNKFAPDDNITFEQAVKIITSAANMIEGYDIESMGGYPDAYVNLGRSYNLYENVQNPVKGDNLTRIDAIVMLSNALGNDYAVVFTRSRLR